MTFLRKLLSHLWFLCLLELLIFWILMQSTIWDFFICYWISLSLVWLFSVAQLPQACMRNMMNCQLPLLLLLLWAIHNLYLEEQSWWKVTIIALLMDHTGQALLMEGENSFLCNSVLLSLCFVLPPDHQSSLTLDIPFFMFMKWFLILNRLFVFVSTLNNHMFSWYLICLLISSNQLFWPNMPFDVLVKFSRF